MTTKFLTKSVSRYLWLGQDYNYPVSDCNSGNSVSDSDFDSVFVSDSSSTSMNLAIFVYFILYLHSSNKPADNFSFPFS